MKTVSLVVAVPLTVMAYNITIKIDSRNIDTLINAVVIAIIILAVVIPSGLYILAYVRDRNRMEGMRPAPARQRAYAMTQHAPDGWGYGAPPPQGWNSQPSRLTAPPAQSYGTFAVQQPMMIDAQPEDWS